jgi:hypothetical protein
VARSQHLSAPSFAAALALVALAPALGCGDGGGQAPSVWIMFDACQPLTLAPDPGIPAAQSDGVAAGIALWNAAAGTKLALAAASDPSVAAGADAATPLTLPVHFQQAGAPFHGLYDAPNGQIFINDDLTDHQLAVTLAHEVGHAFGLLHRTDQPSLMNPSNLMIEPQPVDIDTLETRWGACQ